MLPRIWVLTGVMISIPWIVAANPGKAEDHPLILLWQDHYGWIETIHCDTDTHQTTVSIRSESRRPIEHVRSSVSLDLTDGRFSLDSWSSGSERYSMHSDGNRHCLMTSSSGWQELPIAPPDPTLECAPLLALRRPSDAMLVEGIFDVSLLAFLTHGEVVGLDDVEGRVCHVIEVTHDDTVAATLWVDAERGALPVRTVLYGNDGEINHDEIVTDVKYVPDGSGRSVWIPAAIRRYVRLPDQSCIVDIFASSIELNSPVLVADCSERTKSISQP